LPGISEIVERNLISKPNKTYLNKVPN